MRVNTFKTKNSGEALQVHLSQPLSPNRVLFSLNSQSTQSMEKLFRRQCTTLSASALGSFCKSKCVKIQINGNNHFNDYK